MRLLIVTDAWLPQVNGVTTTLSQLVRHLGEVGHQVERISPEQFRSVPCPTYPEIRLACTTPGQIARRIEAFAPEAIHIATEGPLGLLARRHCLKRGLPFTTSFHTRFPDYVAMRFGVPAAATWAAQRWFHNAGAAMMVAARSLRDELASRGFSTIVPWRRGVDTDLFRPGVEPALDLPRPVFLAVGRLAPEKNLDAFLGLDLPGSKLVVGDGPDRARLQARYGGAHFAGARHGEDLVRHFASADVLVFPSRTDTFGLVMLEALACGLPVAAFPVPGPIDVVGGSGAAVLDEDLAAAALGALELPPAGSRAFAEGFGWRACADEFVSHLRPIAEQRAGAGSARAEEAAA